MNENLDDVERVVTHFYQPKIQSYDDLQYICTHLYHPDKGEEESLDTHSNVSYTEEVHL